MMVFLVWYYLGHSGQRAFVNECAEAMWITKSGRHTSHLQFFFYLFLFQKVFEKVYSIGPRR